MPEQVAAPAEAPQPSFREQVEAAESQETPQEAPAQEADAPVSEKVEEKVEKVVPLAALHEERENRKQFQRQVREYQAQVAEFQKQQVEMLRYMQQQQTPQQPLPDKATDPFGYSVAGIEHVAGQVQSLQQQLQQKEQREAQERQYQTFTSTVSNAEQNFSKQNPDYYEAVQWAMGRKKEEYQAIGMTEQDAGERIKQEASQIAIMALQNGESPAVYAYNLAQKMGYQPKKVTDQQKLAMQKQGQSASMPGSGGGQSNGKLSLDALAKLKGNDFLAATKGDAWRKLMDK